MAVTNQALTGGYQLLNYRIDRQISRGGFSIVYRAFDETGAPVAIKVPAVIVRAPRATSSREFRRTLRPSAG
jgi:serine/threonine protein kinase